MVAARDRRQLEEVRIYSKKEEDGRIVKLKTIPTYSEKGELVEGIWTLLMMNSHGVFVPVKHNIKEDELMPALSTFKVQVMQVSP